MIITDVPNLQNSDDGALYLVSVSFWALSVISYFKHNKIFCKLSTFRKKLDCYKRHTHNWVGVMKMERDPISKT